MDLFSCGYIDEGNEPPENCPICKAPAMFNESKDVMKWQMNILLNIKDVSLKREDLEPILLGMY